MKKTLLVGLDAASWDYLAPLLRAKRLPALQRLIDTGMSGTVESTLPAQTPTAWASIITGKNPGKHGIYDHLWRRPGTYEFMPTNARVRLGTPFWRRLNAYGVRVGLVNVPFTHPPDALDGFVIGGFGTPKAAADKTYPLQELEWIEEQFGEYEPWLTTDLFKEVTPEARLAAERRHQAQQVRMAIELAARHNVDVLAINLMLLDHANHYMPRMDQVEEAITLSDCDLNNLIEGFRPDNVMLISDHGSRRVKGTFALGAWLRDRGCTVQVERTRQGRDNALNWVLLQWLKNSGRWSGTQEKIARNVLRRTVPLLPSFAAHRFWDSVESSVPFAREHFTLGDKVDYHRSLVFPGASYSDLLYLNVKGRDPSGALDPRDRFRFLTELIDKLASIVDPETGEGLIAGARIGDELYTGPMSAAAPDILLDTYSSSHNFLATYTRGATVERLRHGYFIDDRGECGGHSRNGILVFSGQDFRVGAAAEAKLLMDIPATLLHLYGVPIPADFDGHILTDFVTSELLSHPPAFQEGDPSQSLPEEDPYTAQEKEELLGHLRALGYVE